MSGQKIIRKLLIDHERPRYNFSGITDTATSFEAGIDMVKNWGPWDLIILDYNLGANQEDYETKNGLEILKYILEHRECTPRAIMLMCYFEKPRNLMRQVAKKIYGL